MALAWILLVLGGLVCAVNLYASSLRYPLHRLRGGTREDFRWVSPYPIVGSLFVGIAWLVWMDPLGSTTLDVACLVLVLGDTGGLHWFVACGIADSFLERRSAG